jgi:ribosomal protein S18 acetylase RimI-like enzyme
MNATLCPVSELSAEWVRAAHGDAWQALGVRAVSAQPGVRLMATGLPHAQWNNGDVDDPSRVDIAAVRRWYADLGVPWGMRVPAGAAWPHGRRLFTKRLMGLTADAFAPGGSAVVRQALATADLAAYLHVDTVAFDESAQVQRPWLELLLAHPAATVALAEVDGLVVASGHVVVADGRAGRTAYVGGIAVLPEARRRGIGAAISSWLVERAFDDGARMCHLHPDTDHAAAIYRRLGFVEVDGLDIYVDN